MRGFFGVVTIVLVGVMIADMMAHPDGVKAGGNAIIGITSTAYAAMLGYNPLAGKAA